MKKTKVVFLTFIPSFLGGAVGDPNWCWENMPKQIYEVTFGGKLAWHFLVPVLLLSWEILQNTSVALCESGIRIENALISRLCTCLHLQRTKRDIRPMNTVYTVPHTATGWSATCKQHTDILFEIIAVWIQSVGLKFTSPFPYMHVLYMHNMTCRKCSRIYNL